MYGQTQTDRQTDNNNVAVGLRALHYVTLRVSITRKLSYRKDDRATRPTYGCPEKFRES